MCAVNACATFNVRRSFLPQRRGEWQANRKIQLEETEKTIRCGNAAAGCVRGECFSRTHERAPPTRGQSGVAANRMSHYDGSEMNCMAGMLPA